MCGWMDGCVSVGRSPLLDERKEGQEGNAVCRRLTSGRAAYDGCDRIDVAGQQAADRVDTLPGCLYVWPCKRELLPNPVRPLLLLLT